MGLSEKPMCSIAGTHTTSATTTLLFYNLLHYPQVLKKCVEEIDTKLGPLNDEQKAYSVTQVEMFLPYLRLCVRENFRLTPVFTMPLERYVTAPEGIVISGRHIRQGVSPLPSFTSSFPEICIAAHNSYEIYRLTSHPFH